MELWISEYLESENLNESEKLSIPAYLKIKQPTDEKALLLFLIIMSSCSLFGVAYFSGLLPLVLAWSSIIMSRSEKSSSLVFKNDTSTNRNY